MHLDILSKMALKTRQAWVHTPLDSTAIYPTNLVIFHPLIASWPVKCKSPIWYICLEPELCTSSPKLHTITIKSLSSVDQPMLIISNEIVNPQTVVINYQTRIRDLDAFSHGMLPSLRTYSRWKLHILYLVNLMSLFLNPHLQLSHSKIHLKTERIIMK